MRSNKQLHQAGTIGGSYAIETSFCGAKPLINPSTYDLSQHAQDEELGNQSPRWAFIYKLEFLESSSASGVIAV